MRRFSLAFLGLCIIIAAALLPNPASAEEIPLARHTTPEGIDIISYTQAWGPEGLAELAAELEKNLHGPELNYLDRIEVYPGIEPEGRSHVAASYQRELQQVDIPINLTGFLPDGFSAPLVYDKGVIKLYKGDEKLGAEDYAADLSHEYGHHFTFFYFGGSFADTDEFVDSDYYKIRGLAEYDQVNGEYSFEEDTHRWSIFEIAAEDYRQLMGSDTGKGARLFEDISQKVGNETYAPLNSFNTRDYNVIPQENWHLPLAHQVKGLGEYYFSFVGMEYNKAQPEVLPELNYVLSLENGFQKAVIYWEPVAWEGDVTYTLVSYDESFENPVPVKTVFPGQETMAVIGTVTVKNGRYLYYYQDGLDKGTRYFVLHVQPDNGYMAASKPVRIKFESESEDLSEEEEAE